MTTTARKEWWSAAELAAARLPGLPATRQWCSAFIARVRQESPAHVRQRAGRGGGWECHVSALPELATGELSRRRGHFRQPVSTRLPAIVAPSPADHFLERLKECRRSPARGRAARYKLLLAEVIVRYAELRGLSDSAMARHFAKCLSAGRVPFEAEDIDFDHPPMRPLDFGIYSREYGHAVAAYDAWRRSRFIRWYVFRAIIQGAGRKPHREPAPALDRFLKAQISKIRLGRNFSIVDA